jgi:proline racemase
VTTVHIECPCGMVVASVEIRDGKSGGVSFESVPAFLYTGDQMIELPGFGNINFDVAYGGAFYALADCHQFGLEFGRDPARNFIDAATVLTEAVKEAVSLDHPDHKDLAFLYGSILTDGADDWNEGPTKNVCIFADAQLDRSPTGSGVTARLAAMFAKGQIREGNARIFESIVGSRFAGFVASTTKAGDFDAITARVSGHAYYSGKAEFIVEDDDPLGQGFLVL